ncbi:MAG: N-acetylmuramoyl-L-alanine amidase [Planctomycetes bacterium]|nr:N-acetylmuramoyl-L-alanine amidase [Planctomycetota bacterium]
MPQRRNTNVFLAALASIVIGLFVLKSLDHAPVKAHAFSLSDYQRLGSVEKFFSCNVSEPLSDWSGIEIYYYGGNGRGQSLAESNNRDYDYRNCHFVVWNGFIGGNGQIQATVNWQKQVSCAENDIDCDEETIRICIVTEGNSLYPTDIQVKRAETLADVISRKFDITPARIFYPDNWR